MRARWLGALALVLALPAAVSERAVFFAAWLTACWFWLGVVLGAQANAWIHALTGGRWGDVLRPATQRLARGMPWVLVLFVPLVFGFDALYPWLRAGDTPWRDAMARPTFNATAQKARRGSVGCVAWTCEHAESRSIEWRHRGSAVSCIWPWQFEKSTSKSSSDIPSASLSSARISMCEGSSSSRSRSRLRLRKIAVKRLSNDMAAPVAGLFLCEA